MATIASSTPALNISYTLNEIHNGGASSEYSQVGYTALSYPNGTGTGQITMGVVASGYISSGETIRYDFQQFPKTTWDNQILLDFTSKEIGGDVYNPDRGVKGMVVINNWAGSSGSGIEDWFPIAGLPKLNIHSTGTDGAVSGGFTELFNGGSGNVAINPQGTWAFTDVLGKTPRYGGSPPAARYSHVLSLTTENFTNVSGSGGTGVDGSAIYYPIWNDVASGNPWSGNLPRLSYEILVIGVTG